MTDLKHNMTRVQIRAARDRAVEAQDEARACAMAARRLVAEPELDPAFPVTALWMQDLAAWSARKAMRDVNRLVRRTA